MRALVAVLTLAFAAPVAAHPCPSPSPTPATPSAKAPTVPQYLDLYRRTGAALQAAHKVDETATEPLFPRYRMINVNVGVRDAAKRARDASELEKIYTAAKKIAP